MPFLHSFVVQLESIEALIRTKTSPDRRIDLSILDEQDRILANESIRNMEVTEQVQHEIDEAACRRRLDEVYNLLYIYCCVGTLHDFCCNVNSYKPSCYFS